jgi:cytochrome c6
MKKLALFFTLALFIASCGKKDETLTTPPQEQKMTQTQQQTQTKTDEQVKKDELKKDEMKKEDEKKKDDKKTDSQTKDESIRKTDEVSSKDSKSDIDFAPIFAKRCAKCHGKDLKGKPDGGPDLTSSEVKSTGDKKLFNIISNGVKADNEDDEDMPSFKGKLTDDEINAAIKFIKNH